MAEELPEGATRRRLRRALTDVAQDRRRGLDDPILARLRVATARTGDDRLLLDYERRRGLHDDQALQEALYARLNPEQVCPFAIPQGDAELAVLDLAARGFRVGTIGFHGEGLYLDLRKQLLRGLCITGAKGSGKSTLLANIAAHLSLLPMVGTWLFNVRGEASDRLPRFAHVKLSELGVNIFAHQPELEPRVQAESVATIIGSVFYLLRSRTMLTPILQTFYERKQSPTAAEVLQAVRSVRAGRDSGFRADQVTAAIAVLELICRSMSDAASTLRRGMRPHVLAARNLTILLDLGDDKMHAAVICWMLFSLYEQAMARGVLNAPLTTALLVDESAYLLSPQRERQAVTFDAPITEQLVQRQRTAGISLVAATQDVHPDYFTSNSATKVLMRVANAKYFGIAAQAMGLTAKETLYAQRSLRSFEAVVSVPDLFPRPLLTVLERPCDGEQTTDEQARLHDEVMAIVRGQTQQDEQLVLLPEAIRAKSDGMMVRGAGALLCHYATTPLSPLTEAYAALQLGRASGDAARNHLTENGLTEAQQVRLRPGRGGTCTVLEITAEGEAWLAREHPDVVVERLAGRGSLEHRAHQRFVAEHFRTRGFVVKIEHHDADLGVQGQGTPSWIAVEIVTRHSRNVEERIRANHDAGAERTLVVCSDFETKRRMDRELGNMAAVEVQDIAVYLPATLPN